MRRFYAPVIILFAACFLTASFPPEASALQWEFKSAGDLSGWTILDAGSARIENGSLALSARKGVAPRLISPPAIEAPFRAGRLYLSMTVSSRAGGRAEALITSDGTRIYSKTFEFRGNGYEEAGVYLGDILPEGARVRQFAV
ncbi:MAG: hypothetical protein HZB83_02830, partial [Deltaproteobacteria bacterium]|nr:hypothetical protein [Deltaproteobacteria bacterium]